VLIGAGLFDMVDGRVARETNRVTRFGGFFDSVLDRYSDLAVLVGLLVYYASISRFFYVVLTAIVMTGTVMVSYTRARAENIIPKCKVGFLERPERVVLIIIGALFNRMAQVLWIIAVLSNITVISRILFTWQETLAFALRCSAQRRFCAAAMRLRAASLRTCFLRGLGEVGDGSEEPAVLPPSWRRTWSIFA
jgi:phosphatidylglycerophosphate synthase